MCEQLQGKKHYQQTGSLLTDYNYFMEDDIKSAVDFYKKYSFHPEILQVDNYDLYMQMCHKLKGRIVSVGAFGKYEIATSYNNWIFNYTFKEVIK